MTIEIVAFHLHSLKPDGFLMQMVNNLYVLTGNQTHACAMLIHCLDHQAMKVDNSKHNLCAFRVVMSVNMLRVY